MTNYAKGRRAEWAVRDLLLASGAAYVPRSAGSKTPCDLVALFSHRTYCIQVKTYKPTEKDAEGCCYASEHTEAPWVLVWWEGGKAVEVSGWKAGKPYKVLPPGLQGV